MRSEKFPPPLPFSGTAAHRAALRRFPAVTAHCKPLLKTIAARTKLMQSIPREGNSAMLKARIFSLTALLCGLLPFPTATRAAILYVNASGSNPTPPYSSWFTAATNIQDAVNAASAGDEIIVTNGIYTSEANFTASSYGVVTSGVSVYDALTVRSVNGPRVTIIDGGSQVRCIYLTNGATLSGFTLTNGTASDYAAIGGGALCESSAVLSNCVLSGNSAVDGGGSYSGVFYNCTFSGNNAAGGGGGIKVGVLYGCLVVGNSAQKSGGGAYISSLYNCAVVGNSPDGVEGYNSNHIPEPSYAYNCIIYFNSNRDVVVCELDHSCIGSGEDPGTSSFTNNPFFIDTAIGDYRLQSGSPCIDAGANEWVTNSTDLDGNPRIVNGTVDMGAYEYQINVPAPVLQAVTQTNGLVTLTWTSANGQLYQPQYNPDMSPGNWSNLGPPLVATGPTASTTDPLAANTQRFYRIVMLR